MRDIAATGLADDPTRDVDLGELPAGAELVRLWVASTTRARGTGISGWT
jgi:hypothetical protein